FADADQGRRGRGLEARRSRSPAIRDARPSLLRQRAALGRRRDSAGFNTQRAWPRTSGRRPRADPAHEVRRLPHVSPMTLPTHVKLVEVGPRDGLQNEPLTVSTELKVQLINRLSRTGLRVIEAGSFVSPKWVPQMADTAAVLAGINRAENASCPVLVPNMRGLHDARAARAKEIAVFAAASETFSRKNINASIDESLARYQEVCDAARA